MELKKKGGNLDHLKKPFFVNHESVGQDENQVASWTYKGLDIVIFRVIGLVQSDRC